MNTAVWRWLRSRCDILSSDARMFGAMAAFACLVGVLFVCVDLMFTRSLCLYGVVKFC